MMGLERRATEREPRVLLIGAHSDDIEIGCGATVLRLVEEHPDVTIQWVVFGCTEERAAEARASAADFMADARTWAVETHAFPDARFPSRWSEIKDRMQELAGFEPDVVLTHARHDLHQDHRVLAELTWNAFRREMVLEYEVPKYDGDLLVPNVYVPVSSSHRDRKLELLERHFASQRGKHWFDRELFGGLMRLRGAECAAASRYAEAFHGRKIVF